MADSGEKDSIADIVFRRSRRDQLRAEMAFGPVLAFIVTQTDLSGWQGRFVIIAMVLLVVIPFLRFLVYTDRIAPFDQFLNLTVRPVEFCAVIGMIQLYVHLAEFLYTPSISLSIIELTTLIGISFMLLYVLFFELVFQKYRLCWGTLFYLKAVELETNLEVDLNDIEDVVDTIFSEDKNVPRLRTALALLEIALLKSIWGQIAYHMLKDSVPDRNGDRYMAELQNFVDRNQSSSGASPRKGLLFAFGVSAFVAIPVFAFIAWALSILVATTGVMLLALVLMRVTKHIVALSYIGFGTMDFNQFVTTNLRSVLLTGAYTLSVYLVFFYPL